MSAFILFSPHSFDSDWLGCVCVCLCDFVHFVAVFTFASVFDSFTLGWHTIHILLNDIHFDAHSYYEYMWVSDVSEKTDYHISFHGFISLPLFETLATCISLNVSVKVFIVQLVYVRWSNEQMVNFGKNGIYRSKANWATTFQVSKTNSIQV